jgi:hypothetical protein
MIFIEVRSTFGGARLFKIKATDRSTHSTGLYEAYDFISVYEKNIKQEYLLIKNLRVHNSNY